MDTNNFEIFYPINAQEKKDGLKSQIEDIEVYIPRESANFVLYTNFIVKFVRNFFGDKAKQNYLNSVEYNNELLPLLRVGDHFITKEFFVQWTWLCLQQNSSKTGDDIRSRLAQQRIQRIYKLFETNFFEIYEYYTYINKASKLPSPYFAIFHPLKRVAWRFFIDEKKKILAEKGYEEEDTNGFLLRNKIVPQLLELNHYFGDFLGKYYRGDQDDDHDQKFNLNITNQEIYLELLLDSFMGAFVYEFGATPIGKLIKLDYENLQNRFDSIPSDRFKLLTVNIDKEFDDKLEEDFKKNKVGKVHNVPNSWSIAIMFIIISVHKILK